jgi:lipopolysaccharide exporter
VSHAGAIARSSLWVTVGQGLIRVIQFSAQIFLARLLTRDDFGIWAMVLVTTGLSNLFKESAIAQVLIQRGLEDKKQVNAVFSLGVNVSIGLFFFQALVGWVTAYYFYHRPLIWPLTTAAGLVFLIGSGIGAHNAVMVRQMRFREVAMIEIASGFARNVTSVLGAFLGLGVWSFVVGELALMLVESTLKRKLSGYRFTYQLIPDSSALKEVRNYIRGMISLNLAVFANTNSDNVIIGKLLGASNLGVYNLAYQLATLPVYLLSQVNRVNFAVLSRQQSEQRQQYMRQLLQLYALMAAPVFGIVFVAAPWLIPFMYGSQWSTAAPIFQYVLIFAYARGFMSILGTSLNSLGHSEVNAFINWTLVPISIPAYYFGAQWGGTTGVAIAVAIVMGILATVWFWTISCRVTNWAIGALVQPILLPTMTACLAVTLVMKLPLLEHLIYLQPIVLLSFYGVAISLLSGGKIPQMLLNIVRSSLKPGKLEQP